MAVLKDDPSLSISTLCSGAATQSIDHILADCDEMAPERKVMLSRISEALEYALDDITPKDFSLLPVAIRNKYILGLSLGNPELDAIVDVICRILFKIADRKIRAQLTSS